MNVQNFAYTRSGNRVGSSHPRAKFTDDEVATVLELREAGLSYGEIAAKWDDGRTMSRSTVRKIVKGTIRAQVPDHYGRALDTAKRATVRK